MSRKKNMKQIMLKVMKHSDDAKKETNSTAFNKIIHMGGQHACMYCGPWEGDNKIARRAGKHGAKKPRHKIKRKQTWLEE